MLQEDIYSLYKGISFIPNAQEILEVELNLLTFQENYRFLFLDFVNIVNSNSDLANKFRENISFQVNMIVALLEQGVETGNYKKEHQEEFLRLSKLIWNIFFNRLSREIVMNEPYKSKEFAKDIWLILKPFLTKQGIERYEVLFLKNVLKEK